MRKITASMWKVVLVAVFITLLISVIPIQATEYKVGVKVGDWVKYGEFSASTTGTGTGFAQIAALNDYDWMKGEVKSITGTEVTFNTTGQYKTNGTAIPSSTSKINVATGSGQAGLFYSLIAANLTEGDNIVQQQQAGTPAIKINGTVTRTYCKASRSVNYVDFSYTITGWGKFTLKSYWDKATGVMLESFTNMSITTPTAASLELSLKAVETNMWSADVVGLMSTYLIYIVGAVIVVVVIVVGVFMLRRRKPTPPVTPTPTVVEGKSE